MIYDLFCTFAQKKQRFEDFFMENNSQLQPQRPHSAGGCITSGYRLYTTIFRRLLRASWPVAVVYAVAMAAMSSYYISHIIPLMGLQTVVDPETMHSLWVQTMTIAALLAVGFIVAATVLASYGFSAMRQHQATGEVARAQNWWGTIDLHTLGRTAMITVWLLVFTGVFSAVATGLILLAVESGLTSLIVGAAVFCTVLLCLMLPLTYTCYRAVLAEKFSLAPPLKGYISGLGRWGMLFVVVLITGIATLVLTLVAQLPADILYAANIQAHLGAMKGDELGMPEGMWWMNFIVFFIGGFIQAYVHLSTLFPLYYASK